MRGIPWDAARRRLAAAKRRGDYRGTHKSKGAAPLKVRSVAEVRKSREKPRRG